ncbi:hypothetical protein KY289_003884 [Solanum tuberosum]|nr:hypothetical protein KY289_003884 [Solanum tuberosum]
MRHQPRNARIGRGLCASGKRRRPTTCNISQGLHTSVVTCEHRLGDIIRGLRASIRLHRPWPVRISQATSANGRQYQPRPPRINVACAHRLGDIGRGLCASTRRHRPTTSSISQGLHASDLVCAHRVKRRRPTVGNISQGLHSSAVACAHRLGDIGVGQWKATSAKAYRHLMWHVRIGKETSTKGRQHQPRPARINSYVCASVGRYWRRPTTCDINHSLHASDVACVHLENDIDQWHATSAKSCTH